MTAGAKLVYQDYWKNSMGQRSFASTLAQMAGLKLPGYVNFVIRVA
jgi:hypothetical protein